MTRAATQDQEGGFGLSDCMAGWASSIYCTIMHRYPNNSGLIFILELMIKPVNRREGAIKYDGSLLLCIAASCMTKIPARIKICSRFKPAAPPRCHAPYMKTWLSQLEFVKR